MRIFQRVRTAVAMSGLVAAVALGAGCSDESGSPSVSEAAPDGGEALQGDGGVPSGVDTVEDSTGGIDVDSGDVTSPLDAGEQPPPADAGADLEVADGDVESTPQDGGGVPQAADVPDAVQPEVTDEDAGGDPSAPDVDPVPDTSPDPDPEPDPDPDPASVVGCSDGSREGFIDKVAYPKIAACGGAWDVPGIHTSKLACVGNCNGNEDCIADCDDISCDDAAGNDGANPEGAGCNVADLCAPGWHVCYGAVDVLTRNPLGCGGIMDGAQSPAFFVARTSSVGAFECSQDSTQFGGPGTSNDLFGCGDLGCPTSQGTCASSGKCDPLSPCETCEEGFCEDGTACNPGTCFPLTRGSHDKCKSIRNKSGCNCSFAGELDPGDAKYVEGDMETVVCSPGSGGCGWCKPLNYWNKKLGVDHPDVWECGSSTTQEANNVVKTDVSQGGVLCCSDEGFEPGSEPEPDAQE